MTVQGLLEGGVCQGRQALESVCPVPEMGLVIPVTLHALRKTKGGSFPVQLLPGRLAGTAVVNPHEAEQALVHMRLLVLGLCCLFAFAGAVWYRLKCF